MIRLVVDSSADLMQEELEACNISLVPLQVTIGNQSYYDGVDLFRDEFYELLTTSTEFPKTSQPSPQDFVEIFEKAKEQGDTLLCILLSSALSGTYQSAVLAKSIVEYDGIYLIDSLSATVGTRMLVEAAKGMVAAGNNITEIVEYLEEMKKHIKILAAVDTLEYLCRGGRVSKTAAAIGEMASLTPLITVSAEGKVEVVGKRPGTQRAISFLMKKLAEYELHEAYPLYSLFTYGTSNCEKLEAKLIKENYQIKKRQQIGPTIGTHVGPEAFGICFVEKF